jgi:hypothetical protein
MSGASYVLVLFVRDLDFDRADGCRGWIIWSPNFFLSPKFGDAFGVHFSFPSSQRPQFGLKTESKGLKRPKRS